MPVKYYAVKIGKKPGIYQTWNDCRAVVHGYPGAVYKSFPTRAEAEAFLGAGIKIPRMEVQDETEAETDLAVTGKMPEIYAFVDGSYNAAEKIYGYGGYLVHHGVKEIIKGSGCDAEMAAMRNVAGEVLGSMAAVRKAVELGLPEITIYYDYMGIEMWADGSWKRNKKGTKDYYDYICSVRDRISIRFVKVKGHSGIPGNEEADRLAKEACGNL